MLKLVSSSSDLESIVQTQFRILALPCVAAYYPTLAGRNDFRERSIIFPREASPRRTAAGQRRSLAAHPLPRRRVLVIMPVRVVHHSMVVRALNSRATASWGRMRSAFKPPPPARFPIPLLLPCEILLIVAEMLPPEACACLVNCCSYMRGLYCEDGTFATEQLWGALLRRTFPQRYTGAPGPNAPPRLRGSARLALGVFARDWVGYRRMLRAVRPLLPPPSPSRPCFTPHPPCRRRHAPCTRVPRPSPRPLLHRRRRA